MVFEGGSPVDLVRGAASRARRDDYDEVWVVCDVDNFDTSAAESEARTSGVYVVWSRPSFELWLILHKQDCRAFMESAERCAERLATVIGTWDKARLDFGQFRDGVEDASRRARSLGEPPAANPSTAMWKIIELLKS